MHAAIPEFELIKDRVQKDWINQRKLEEASKIAAEITQQSKNLGDLTKLADKYGLSLNSNHVISRSDVGEKGIQKDESTKALLTSLSHELLNKMFQLKVEQATYGSTKDGFLVIMLQRINPYIHDDKKSTNFNISIDQMSGKILSDLIVNSFRLNHKVSINQDTMDHIMNQE